ncbi:MAG: DNA polymerase III subunit delta [Brevinemataceae bacterium]
MADIVIVGGENPVFIREEFHKIVLEFSEDSRRIYFGDELDVELFFEDLLTGSLFTPKRLIAVKHASQTKSEFEKKILEYVNHPSDSAVLLLEYDKIPTKILDAASKLGSKTVKVFNFKKSWREDQKSYIQRRLRDAGINYSSGVVELIIDLAGSDIEEISGMLDRLTDFLGSDKELNEEKTAFVLQKVQNASIFDLTDAIFQRNIPTALQAFHDLIYSGQSFMSINAMFFRAAKIMWAVKTSPNAIPKGFAVSPYEWKKYQGFSSKTDLKFLSRCFELISVIEVSSKTRPDFVVETLFETFLTVL